MGKLNQQNMVLKIKQGVAANINVTVTKNLAVEGEPHWATDSNQLYIFDGTQNLRLLIFNSDDKYDYVPFVLAGDARAWKSVEQLNPTNIGKPSANPPGAGLYQEFSFDRYDRATEESVFFIWHVPTDFSAGNSNVRAHFGFLVENPPAGASEAVVLGFEYKKISAGDVFDFSAGTTSGTLTITIVDGESAYKWHESGTGMVTTTGWAAGDIIMFRFYRDATNANDTYDNEGVAADNDVWIGQYHLEYMIDKFGEAP